MKTIGTLFVISFLFFGNINAQIMTRLAEFPGSARRDLITFSIGDKIYVGGGMNSDKFLQDLWEYNTKGDVWTQKHDFPSDIAVGNAIVLNATCYVSLGGDGTKSLNEWWQYDSTNDSWTRKADFPGSTNFDASFVIWDNEIYAFGVVENNISGSIRLNNEIWKYDLSTDSWSLFDKFPGKARHSAIAKSFGNLVLYGFGQNETSNELYDDMYSYNLKTKSWKNIASIPSGMHHAGGNMNFAGTNDNTLFLISTDYDKPGEEDLNKIYSYNILNDKWGVIQNTSNIPWRLFGLGASLGSIGYTGLGYDYISDIWYNDMWKIDLNALARNEYNQSSANNIKVNTLGENMIIELPHNLWSDSTLMMYSVDGKAVKNIALAESTEVSLSLLPENNYVWTIVNKGNILRSGKVSNIK